MLDDKSEIEIIYIDLQKAVDSLTNKKLLFMLSKIRIGGNIFTWFSTILIERFFNVKKGNVRSKYTTINSGDLKEHFLGPY